MEFHATKTEIYLIFKAAVAASKPMGMGHNQHDPNYELSYADFEKLNNGSGYYADYVKGRMVKLSIRPVHDDETWEIIGKETPDCGYQSFADTYKTWDELLNFIFKETRGGSLNEKNI